MRVLWLCNMMLPKAAENINKQPDSFGGWLTGLSNDLLKINEVQLAVCFPISFQDHLLEGEVENMKYFGFPQKDQDKYDEEVEKIFISIIKKINPEVIHIFGTEYPHALAMVNTCEILGILRKVVISIQGLVSVYPTHYFASLPYRVIKGRTFRDFIRRQSIEISCKKMREKGALEIEALKKAKHIIGRTSWDNACTSQINSKAAYHFCNETLRNEFYKHEWSLEQCEPHSICISQASYPIKGAHYMLEALKLILNEFPETKLYIAGYDITKSNTVIGRLKHTSYAKYIKELIQKLNLKENLIFTGILNEKQMCDRYLKSNVFVLPSSIENSPNSLGEAMMLGLPCVASYVGGVSDMLKHNEEGFLYQADAPYMLAYYVCEIFKNNELALKFSKNARQHALETHNKEENVKKILQIYDNIMNVNMNEV